MQLTLPPGSESFPLSSAPTGHFLLPFQDYARYTSARAKTAPSAIKHLFTEGNSPTGEHSSGAEASSSTVKVTIAAAVTEVTEEASGVPEEPIYHLLQKNRCLSIDLLVLVLPVFPCQALLPKRQMMVELRLVQCMPLKKLMRSQMLS